MVGDAPAATQQLYDITKAHGTARYQHQFDVAELIVEYRLLRRVVVDELRIATGGGLTVTEVMALDVGIDIALQQAVVAFVQHLAGRSKPQ